MTFVFWGEWEPQSRVMRTYSDPVPGGPLFLFEPYYALPTTWPSRGPQNTDPFVFGDQFHYTGCLQHTKRGATQLRYLDRGSIILFGSCREKRHFVIDTVFVVDRWIDHDRANQRTPEVRGAVSSTYGDVTLDPWYCRRCPCGAKSPPVFRGDTARAGRRHVQLLPLSACARGRWWVRSS